MSKLAPVPWKLEFNERGGCDATTPCFDILDRDNNLVMVCELSNFAKSKKQQMSIKPTIEAQLLELIDIVNKEIKDES